jgi:hypothetical protein
VTRAGRISCNLFDAVECIEDLDEADTALAIHQIINETRRAFDSNLLLVILYIVPLLPNSVSEPNHLQKSLVT